MDKTIEQITANFSDIKKLIDDLNVIKTQERKTKRRLNTKRNEYSFLEDIVGMNKKDNELIEPIFKYFKSLKLSIHRSPNGDKGGIEDLRLFLPNRLIIIEASSIKNPNPTEVKTHQISKHINIRQQEKQFSNLKVTGLTIINHSDTEHFTKRSRTCFIKRQGDIAAANDYTLTNTISLLLAFIRIEAGAMNIDDLTNGLTTAGIYELT